MRSFVARVTAAELTGDGEIAYTLGGGGKNLKLVYPEPDPDFIVGRYCTVNITFTDEPPKPKDDVKDGVGQPPKKPAPPGKPALTPPPNPQSDVDLTPTFEASGSPVPDSTQKVP